MARHVLTERNFIVEMPDGSELVGYPLTIGQEREFLRAGTWDAVSSPANHTPDEIYAAGVRIIAAVLRKSETFVEDTFSGGQLAQLFKIIVEESRPVPEDADPKAASL